MLEFGTTFTITPWRKWAESYKWTFYQGGILGQENETQLAWGHWVSWHRGHRAPDYQLFLLHPMYLIITSSTFPDFLVNCWAPLPVPQPGISASRAWLRGRLSVPKGINHPSPASTISLFPASRWANHSIIFLQGYQKIISIRATKQNNQIINKQKSNSQRTWDSLFSLPGQSIQYPCHRGILAFARSVVLQGGG